MIPQRGLYPRLSGCLAGWLAEAASRKLTVTLVTVCYRGKLTKDARRSIVIALRRHRTDIQHSCLQKCRRQYK